MRYLQITLMLLIPLGAFAQQRIEPKDVDFGPGRISARSARQHLGEQATVCGRVSRPPYRLNGPGSPAAINLGEAFYTGQDFRILVPDSVRTAFGDLNRYYGKLACASGRIESSRLDRTPEIVVVNPTQIFVLQNLPPQGRCRPCERFDGRQGRCVQWRACM